MLYTFGLLLRIFYGYRYLAILVINIFTILTNKLIESQSSVTLHTTYKVLDQCPTCIQAKIYRTQPGHGTTRVATQSYQGLPVEFALYGMTSYESDQNNIYEGINGETCRIFITDNFSGMKHEDEIMHKASPIS